MTFPLEPADPTEPLPQGERRRHSRPLSPLSLLAQLPALVVLQRFPVPTLAVDDRGAILFANQGFAELVGRDASSLTSMNLCDVLPGSAAEGRSVRETLRAHAGSLVQLRHADGFTITAKISESALLRSDDPLTLVAFDDVTENIWTNLKHGSSSGQDDD